MNTEYSRYEYPSIGKKYAGEKAIISLTSWKKRINTVSKTLFSLIKQCPGFHIVLVLSEVEFPKKEYDIPSDLMLFAENDLIEILWVHNNYKSFKKVLFTMDKYRDIPVISADDDCIYTCNYAEVLYKAWCNHKDCIITNNGMPYKVHSLTWGRGPNTLYAPTFTSHIDYIKKIIYKINEFGDDDCFYGLIADKFNIKYVDLMKPCFYKFHTLESPLSKTLKGINYFINLYKGLLL